MPASKRPLLFAVLLSIITVVSVVLCLFWHPHNEQIPQGIQADSLVVFKGRRKLQVYSAGSVIATYQIALGKQPVGAKQFEGDNKTPEGMYTIYAKNPNSKYHKNLGISYPNRTDILRAGAAGRSPGGDIKIHGLPNNFAFTGRLQSMTDWTAGCIALNNEDLDTLYKHVAIGIPIDIRP